MKRKNSCAVGSKPLSCVPLALAALIGTVLLGIGHVPSLRACDVPVFRYALERWEALPYRLVVLHREPLKEEERAIVDSLSKAAQDEEQPVNLLVQTADLSKEKPQWTQALYKHLSSPALPCAVLLQADLAAMYAGPNQEAPGGVVVWSGPLEKNIGQRLLDSPARREIARRLLKGDSAVWVLLESGDKAKDDAAAETISKSLKEIQEALKLPGDPTADSDSANAAPDDLPNIDVSEGVPLKVAFSVLKLSRTDTAEEGFVKMLLATQTEPPAAQSEPETTETDAGEKKDDAGEKKVDADEKKDEKKADAQSKPADAADKEDQVAQDKVAADKAGKGAKTEQPQTTEPEPVEPAVFVVFGRGRVLGSLTGKEIEADSIAGGCEFLAGDCSCVIKDNRPGTDLLMAVNWDKTLAGESLVDQALPPLTGVLPSAPSSVAAAEKAPAAGSAAPAETPAAAAEAATLAAIAPRDITPSAGDDPAGDNPAGEKLAGEKPADDNVVRNLVIVLVVVLGVVALGTVVLLRRGGEKE